MCKNVCGCCNKKLYNGKFLVLMLLFLGASLCVGCSKGEDDIAEQLKALEADSSADEDGLVQSLGIEEEWNEEIIGMSEDGKTVSVRVAAQVSVPDTSCMSVVAVEGLVIDKEKKKQLLESICEKGTVTNKVPKSILEADLVRCEQYISESQKEQAKWIEEYGVADGIEAEYLDGLYEKRDQLAADLEEAEKEDASVAAPDYTQDEFYGLVDGRIFRFFFWDNSVYAGLANIHDAQLPFPLPEEIYCDYECCEEQAENLCQFSSVEAENLSFDFLGRLGLQGYAVDSCQALKWRSSEDIKDYGNGVTIYSGTDQFQELGICGYGITFGRDVNGIASNTEQYSAELLVEQQRSRMPDGDMIYPSIMNKYGMEAVSVVVDNAGVVGFHIQYPYQNAKVLTQEASLLKFEEIKELFRGAISSRPDLYAQGNLCLDRMDLIYFMCRQADGTFALTPVWRLSRILQEDELEEDRINAAYMINAMDGTEIDVMDELFEISYDE